MRAVHRWREQRTRMRALACLANEIWETRAVDHRRRGAATKASAAECVAPRVAPGSAVPVEADARSPGPRPSDRSVTWMAPATTIRPWHPPPPPPGGGGYTGSTWRWISRWTWRGGRSACAEVVFFWTCRRRVAAAWAGWPLTRAPPACAWRATVSFGDAPGGVRPVGQCSPPRPRSRRGPLRCGGRARTRSAPPPRGAGRVRCCCMPAPRRTCQCSC